MRYPLCDILEATYVGHSQEYCKHQHLIPAFDERVDSMLGWINSHNLAGEISILSVRSSHFFSCFRSFSTQASLTLVPRFDPCPDVHYYAVSAIHSCAVAAQVYTRFAKEGCLAQLMASTLGFERLAFTALVNRFWTLVVVNHHSSHRIVIVCLKTVSAFVSALTKQVQFQQRWPKL